VGDGRFVKRTESLRRSSAKAGREGPEGKESAAAPKKLADAEWALRASRSGLQLNRSVRNSRKTTPVLKLLMYGRRGGTRLAVPNRDSSFLSRRQAFESALEVETVARINDLRSSDRWSESRPHPTQNCSRKMKLTSVYLSRVLSMALDDSLTTNCCMKAVTRLLHCGCACPCTVVCGQKLRNTSKVDADAASKSLSQRARLPWRDAEERRDRQRFEPLGPSPISRNATKRHPNRTALGKINHARGPSRGSRRLSFLWNLTQSKSTTSSNTCALLPKSALRVES